MGGVRWVGCGGWGAVGGARWLSGWGAVAEWVWWLSRRGG